MSSQLAALNQWVEEVARLTQADTIHWCDGSAAEYDELVSRMLASGELHARNAETHPNCYLHRSHPSDVARVEHLTFVCTTDRSDAGPNNHWMSPADAHAKMDGLFDGCMRGRTLYVVPYCMGPLDSPLSRCGVEITDSAYVVANMRIMTRMGRAALERIEREGAEHAARGLSTPSFVKGLHSIGELDPERRFIMHFPEELSIQSYGSGYGGNALLGKKCHALRIASYQAMREGWLAGTLDPAGLSAFCDPARVLIAQTKDQTDTLAVAEEALKDGAVALVVIETTRPLNLREGRRLQLAAKAGPSTGLCLIPEGAGSPATETRWHCTPVFDPAEPTDSTLMRWEIIKNKSGTTGAWHVRWNRAAHRLDVVSPVGERPGPAAARG